MAVTNAQIVEFLLANPGMSDADIVAAMETYKISPAQMAETVGIPEGQIAARVAETVPQGQTVTLGDTIVQPVYTTTGSGEDQQVGGLENVITYKATDNKEGGEFTQYKPTGEFEKTGTQQEVKSGLKEFAIGAGLLFGLPSILNAGATGATTFAGEALADASLLSSGGATVPFAGEALADAGLLSGGGAATGATALTPTALTPAATAPTVTGMGAGTGIKAGTALAGTGVLTGSTLGTTAAAGGLLTTAATKAAESVLGKAVTGALTTGGGILQAQTSKEAAQKAQSAIEAETAAAKAAAQFRPVGMTTRFGTSEFKVDPTTGRLTSAAYTLSPEAKAAQDRFVKLAEAGLTQAEGAQKAFEPLQTGAQSLFTLGNKYLAQTPESVAENYLKSQMALLQPGRELELANLQNKLQQQGRAGLSVAMGGNLGATTPELQALYNARAQQEALLAANAQREGQQNVLFGAGLLGTGATTMGQYYGGQQAAYSPYTTALGQVQALEGAGQQPLTMGIDLGKIGATTGYDVGRLGLQGTGQSVALATGPAATNNPYATALSALGSSGLLSSGVDMAAKAIGNQLDPGSAFRTAIKF